MANHIRARPHGQPVQNVREEQQLVNRQKEVVAEKYEKKYEEKVKMIHENSMSRMGIMLKNYGSEEEQLDLVESVGLSRGVINLNCAPGANLDAIQQQCIHKEQTVHMLEEKNDRVVQENGRLKQEKDQKDQEIERLNQENRRLIQQKQQKDQENAQEIERQKQIILDLQRQLEGRVPPQAVAGNPLNRPPFDVTRNRTPNDHMY